MKYDEFNTKPKFRRVGGSFQLSLDSARDLASILALDEAHWAVTGLDIDTLRSDRQFLEFVDGDRNGQIRAEEVKKAVRWLLELVNGFDGIDRGSDALTLAEIDRSTPEGEGIYEAAALILHNLRRDEHDAVTLADARNEKQIIACAERNGDGIIPVDALRTPGAAALADDVIAYTGAKTDLSGKPGLDGEGLETFLAAAAAHLAWRDAGTGEVLREFGDATGAVHAAYSAIREIVDAYFLACVALEFGASQSPSRPDPLDREAVAHFLESAPAATPRIDRVLDFAGPLNPLWRDRLRAFASLPEVKPFLGKAGALTEAEWLRFKARLAPYDAWCGRKPAGDMDSFPTERLRSDLDPANASEIRDAIAADLSVAPQLQCSENLCKLLLYQKYMLEFVNNFVCLAELFNPKRPSMLQVGRLILDGRHFTLLTPVKNIAEHKNIAKLSDICVMYVETATGTPGALKKVTLAAAVTSGDMRNLFIGKRGIFLAPDGTQWDARVIDFIQQPVSISEALRMPFYRFGEFIGKQADKFLAAKSGSAQKTLEGNISNMLNAPPEPKPASGNNTSMLLMGGGIGLAAIGSSVAFIVKSLQNVSIWNILAVIGAILLIFGGPIIVMSLIKLYRRNMARFLEANACAVNRPMRLSRRMGVIFTFRPKLPRESLLKGDIVDSFHKPVNRRRLILLLVLLALLIACAALRYRCAACEAQEQAAANAVTCGAPPCPPPAAEPAEPAEPAAAPETPAAVGQP